MQFINFCKKKTTYYSEFLAKCVLLKYINIAMGNQNV